MTTKELINKTFDEVIRERIGDEQIVPPQIVEKTDKNITKICKEVIK